MSIGHFIKDIVGYSFNEPDSIDPYDSLKENLVTFKSLCNSLSSDVKAICFNEISPLIPGKMDDSILGMFQEEVLEIGGVLKSKGVRVVSIFSDKSLGFANENFDVITYLKWLVLNHCEFLEMARLDYTSLIYMPYGAEYLCDYNRFKINLSRLPRHVKNRIGIFDSNNFKSMVVADNQGLPWLFNADEDSFDSPIFGKCKEVYKSLGLAPNSTPLAIKSNRLDLKDACVISRKKVFPPVAPVKKSRKLKLR